MKKTFLILFLVMFIITGAYADDIQDRSIVQVEISQFTSTFPTLDVAQRDLLDIVGIHRESGTMDILVNNSNLNILSESGVNYRTVKNAEEMREDRIDPEYFDYDEVTATLASYETTYPSIMTRMDLGTTFEGRHIWGVKISDNPGTEEDEPCILVIGLHRAREIMSTEISMDMINYLLTNYGSDPDVTNWVSSWQIYIIPMLNPDGSAYCWSEDQYWIKNRRDFGNEVYGVDLSHNYPIDWNSCFGSSSDPNSNSYHGPTALSEPETSAVAGLAAAHRFVAVLSYRSFDEYLLTPYGCQGKFMPDRNLYNQFYSSVASEIRREDGGYGYTFGPWWQLLYGSDGTETDYFYSLFGSASMAIEVNTSTYYPTITLRNTTIVRNRPGWMKVLDLYTDSSIIYGRITDSCTGDPLEAEVMLEEYPLSENESPRTSDPVTGQYTCFVQPGEFRLHVSAEGYIERIVNVCTGSTPVSLDLGLTPLSEPSLSIWSVYVADSEGDNDYQLDPGETANLNVCLLAPGLAVSGITAVLTTSDPYLTILDDSASWPDIPFGSAALPLSDTFRVQASAGAPEHHIAAITLTFSTNETLCTNTDYSSVSIQTYYELCPYWEENMNVDPDWIITAYPTSGSPPGPYNNWEFGVPVLGPPSAYSGTNVYGTGLDGNYDDRWTLCLSTPPIDCSGITDSTLVLARFLQIEEGYDRGRIRIRNNGVDWITIWDTENVSNWSNDTNWVLMEQDISSYADGEPNVEIRFDVRADSSINESGFYVDDVKICGNYYGILDPEPTPTSRPTWTPTSPPTVTPTITPTPSPTATDTPLFTPTFTATPSPPPPTYTPTPTPTGTFFTPTYTPTPTPTNTQPPTSTPTPTPPNTFTPTFTPSPTATRTPTRTPTMTPTPTSTFTNTPSPTPVTNTPTPTLSPTFTNTPAPTDTPEISTPTPVPTDTPPAELFKITLLLNKTIFNPGDEFLLECDVERWGPTITVDQYILLDVAGIYFYWPQWTMDLDREVHTYSNGHHEKTTILQFDWPQVEGHFQGIKFYAGCCMANTANIAGDISIVEFSY